MQRHKKRIIVTLIQILFVQPQSNDRVRLENSKRYGLYFKDKHSALINSKKTQCKRKAPAKICKSKYTNIL